jgi:CRISPR-associated protein Cas5t
VKGWLHNVLGAKNGEYHEMAVSIAGNYGSVVYDLQKIVVPKEESDVWYVVNLVDVELCIHVNASFETLERIRGNIYSSFWGLGRKEDTMRLDFVGIVEVNEMNYMDYIQLPQLPHCSMYLKQKTAERLNINGSSFRLNWKYRITPDGLRVFDVKKDLVYVSSLYDSLDPMAYFGEDGGSILVDDENIPVDLVGDERYEN